MDATNVQQSVQGSGAAVCLGAQNVHKRYGEVHANRGISFAVAPGSIHAVVGENGAGKSTLMRILQGLEKPDEGTVVVDDRPVRLSGPHDALSLGIGMVHQEFMLAENLTLLENFALGAEPLSLRWGPVSTIDWTAARRAGDDLAARIGIAIDWQRRAGSAPVHTQQFLEIIRLLNRGARVLILDEPTSVLAPPQVNDLFAVLRALRDEGTTIVFISHKIREVMALADRVTVIRRGEVTFESAVAETDEEAIAAHIMGSTQGGGAVPKPRVRSTSRASGERAVLEVHKLCAPSIEKSHPLHSVTFSIRPGEIVGLAGVSGNGQDELVECLVGLRRAQSGQIIHSGSDISGASTGERRARGMGFVSPDRAHEGLAVTASVLANAIVGSHRKAPLKAGPFLRISRARQAAKERLGALGVTYGSLGDAAKSLSGGNQQRLVFAREIAGDPSLLIVSQPTRGVDLNGIAAIHAILRDFRNAGGAVFLVSEELEELVELSDRILVMAGGRIVGEQARPDVDLDALGRMMVMHGASDA
jgi:simple sugar transport system ATP-binding protein